VCVLDEDFRIRYVSPLLATVLGVESTACGSLLDLVHPVDHNLVAAARTMADGCDHPDGIWGVWNLRRPDGTRVLVEVHLRDLRRDRLVRGFVVTMRDMTERREHEQERIRQALENRGAWQNRQSVMNRFR
ncbi:MAG: PAS domain S-box protein, partial [Micromonosporaceae bacterium]|nr:PAS domain S-box protein [Micromonosporaceae bacterium]